MGISRQKKKKRIPEVHHSATVGRQGSANLKDHFVIKHDQLLVKAKQQQEVLSKNARFEQIWRSRKGNKEEAGHDSVYEMCKLYDVVRVDVGKETVEEQQNKELEDHKMMSQYLPLLREVLPSAALEIECNIHDYVSRQELSDDYVYDLYCVNEHTEGTEADSASQFPLVQVDDDDDFYDGPHDSEYETDDSNAENHPFNDYPDEEESDDENEVSSHSSYAKSEIESRSSRNGSEALESGSDISDDHEDSRLPNWSKSDDPLFDDGMYSDGDNEVYDYDDSGDGECS